jgi:hypothetical protein
VLGKLLLRFGLTLIAIGAVALVALVIYNHGLEDTLPFFLYLIAWVAVPIGSLCCLVAMGLRLLRRRSQQ